MAGTTGLEPAASAVTGQRSNQLNYVPTRQINEMRNNQFLCGLPRFSNRALFARKEQNALIPARIARKPHSETTGDFTTKVIVTASQKTRKASRGGASTLISERNDPLSKRMIALLKRRQSVKVGADPDAASSVSAHLLGRESGTRGAKNPAVLLVIVQWKRLVRTGIVKPNAKEGRLSFGVLA